MVSSVTFGVILVWLWSSCSHANGCYTSIISFGASQVDTGNQKQLASITNTEVPCASPPFGQDFFNHQPTGRCSNGRLMIDFLAESLGLPLVPAFWQFNGSDNMVTFKKGVNYAVSGATAMDVSVYKPGEIILPMKNASLEVQLSWFRQSLPSICGDPSNCRDFIGQSLILLGEIGGNDYSEILEGKTIEDVEPRVPLVIDTIISALTELIEMGAKSFVVPGDIPVGCYPLLLTLLGSEYKEYDPKTGCLVRLNQFIEYHNNILQAKLDQVQELHPDVNIIYGDYYNAAMEIFLSPHDFGFTNGVLKACCGGQGPYNFDPSVLCGDPSSTVCDEPDTYVSWDGVHPTEAAYRVIFKSLLSTPQFNSLCSTSTSGFGLSNRV